MGTLAFLLTFYFGCGFMYCRSKNRWERGWWLACAGGMLLWLTP